MDQMELKLQEKMDERRAKFFKQLDKISYYHLEDIWGCFRSYLDLDQTQSYIVGGSVRDFLLNKDPKDFDLVTNIPMSFLAKALKEAGWKVSETGQVFLVLSIQKDGRQYEIANFRKDGVYLDGRRPETVEIGNIGEDANRRDFTINALYYDYDNGALIDPTGKGLEDLRNKVLRFIGKPKDRIQEDYLRIFRFYRFLTKGFLPDPKSLKACREYFNEGYSKISPDRVREELEKIVL